MSTELVTVEPEAPVAEALSLMQKHSIHELPVMDGSTLRGWISYRTLVRHGGAAPQTKIHAVMEQPPRLPKDLSVIEAADLMIRNNVRAAPVVDGKGKVVGVLSRTDVLRAVLDLPQLAKLQVTGVMNSELETIEENEPLDKAVSRLRNLQIGQLLVLDRNGRLGGSVSLEDLVPAHTQEHAPDSSNHGRGSAFHKTGHHQKNALVEVKGFVRDAPTVGPDATLADAIRLMQKRGSNFVAVEDDGFAVGVLSRSNVVERVARLRPPEGVLCQVIGLGEHADPGQLDAIYEMAQHALHKIANEVKIEFLNLHYKVYKAKAEGSEKFSLSLHLSTEGKFIVQKSDAWDPVDATKKALDDLEGRVLNLKEMRLEKRKGPPRRRAAFYTATRSD
jgi:CBS domain-containing protein